jgi:hypothetical protein
LETKAEKDIKNSKDSENAQPVAEQLPVPAPTTTPPPDSKLRSWISYLLDRQLHFIVLAVALAYLGYSWYSLQNHLAQIETYNPGHEVALTKSNNTLHFVSDNANIQPELSTNLGETLISLNSKDSTLTLNNTINVSLWETLHSFISDPQQSKLYHHMSYNQAEIYQEITLGTQPGHYLLEYYYRNDGADSDVTLKIAHQGQFSAVKISPTSFEATLPGQVGQPPASQPKFKFKLSVNTAGTASNAAPVTITTDSVTNNSSATEFYTTYSYKQVPFNSRALVASEEISWEDTTLPK